MILPLMILQLLLPLAHMQGTGSDRWDSWGPYGECSRSCGSGVAVRSRRCITQRTDGGHNCVGPDKSYRSCNIQDCPEGSKDFREEQCSKFDGTTFQGKQYQWVPYYGADNPCELNCMPKGENFFYRHGSAVVDGTPCHPGRKDVCVGGVCKRLGCDNKLESPVQEDPCLQCGGNGQSCHQVKDLFVVQDLPTGYNQMVIIPVGATSISIRELEPTRNYLAVKNLNGDYYLNGHWVIEFSTSTPIGGTVLYYQRGPEGDNIPETIVGRGPTTEPLVIEIISQEPNQGVEFEYYLPNGGPSEGYSWSFGSWSPCSKECGSGFQSRKVFCSTDNESYPDYLCASLPRPKSNRTCNPQPCPQTRSWKTGQWDSCSVSCGGGTQVRKVECISNDASGPRVVEDSVCAAYTDAPSALQTCNMQICAEYKVTNWSPCSASCGSGEQTRDVTCVGSAGSPMQQSACSSLQRPSTVQQCVMPSCSRSSKGAQWQVGEWGLCSKSCGSGTRQRKVICADERRNLYPEEECGAGLEPPRMERCNEQPCYSPQAVPSTQSPQGYNPDDGFLPYFPEREAGGRDDPVRTNSVNDPYSFAPTIHCSQSFYGCCSDGHTSAKGPTGEGCLSTSDSVPYQQSCIQTSYGCCKDGVTFAQGPNQEGCVDYVDHTPAAVSLPTENAIGCRLTTYGCCFDRTTPANGPDGEGCRDPPNNVERSTCSLPRAAGSCSGWTPRYHYDVLTQKCAHFWYGGCHGNNNNFMTQAECQKTCPSPTAGQQPAATFSRVPSSPEQYAPGQPMSPGSETRGSDLGGSHSMNGFFPENGGLSGGAGRQPKSGIGRRPTSGMDRRPTNGMDRRPTSGMDRNPTRGMDRQPSNGMDRNPFNGGGRLPTSGKDRYPSSGTDRFPHTGGMDRQPSTSGGRQPTGGMDRWPTGSMDRQPSTSGGRQPTGGMDRWPTSDMDRQPSTNGGRQPTGGMDREPTTGGGRQPTSGIDRPSTNCMNRQPSTSGGRQPTGGMDRPSTTCMNRQPSSGMDRRPTSGMDRRPTSGMDRQPSSGMDRRPTTGMDRQPSSGMDRRPTSGMDRQPSSGMDRRPTSGMDRQPSSGMDRRPTSGMDRQPTSGMDRRPTSGMDRQPSSGMDRRPTSGMDRQPSSGMDRRPTSGMNRHPSTSGGRQPTSGMDRHPTSGNGRQPTHGMDRQPTHGMDRYPTNGMERQPTHGMGRQPANGMDRQPSHGMGRQPANGMDRYPTNGMDRQPTHGMGRQPANGMDKYPTNGMDRYPTNGMDRYPTNGMDRHPTNGMDRQPSKAAEQAKRGRALIRSRHSAHSTAAHLSGSAASLTLGAVTIDKTDPDRVEALVGQTVVLPCRLSSPPSPFIVMEWRRDGIPLSTHRHHQQPGGSLLVGPLVESDSGWFLCVATRERERDHRYIYLSVTERSPEPAPTFLPKDGPFPKFSIEHSGSSVVEMRTGQTARLSCLIVPPSARQSVHTQWTKDGRSVSDPRHTQLPDGTLIIGPLKSEDSGIYTCTASSLQQLEQKQLQLKVQDLKITTAPDNIQVSEGSTALLPCVVSGDNVNIGWSRNGVPVRPDGINVLVSSDGSLILSSVKLSDEGTYTCNAYTGIYSVSATADVRVLKDTPATPAEDLPPDCVDQPELANCRLILYARLCSNQYYSSFCCATCASQAGSSGRPGPLW